VFCVCGVEVRVLGAVAGVPSIAGEALGPFSLFFPPFFFGFGVGAGVGTLSTMVTSLPFPATNIGPLSACGARLAAAAVTDAIARPRASEDDAVVFPFDLPPLLPWILK
jgi:hypothetical protein